MRELADVNAVVKIALGLDFTISTGEIEQLTAQYELSDEELEDVTGGTSPVSPAFAVTDGVSVVVTGAQIGAAIFLDNKYGNGGSGG